MSAARRAAARRVAGLGALLLLAGGGACSRPARIGGLPAHFVLTAGVTRQLAAVASYRDGYQDTVNARAAWRSSAPAVAAVRNGLVTALAPGAARISATLDDGTLASQVTVVAAPGLPRAVGPLTVSRRNPRYFALPSGAPVYLTGSHTWDDFQDADTVYPPHPLDYARFLGWLLAHGHNYFRLYVWEQARWSAEYHGDYYFAPLPYLRTGPGTALDGRPRFDLTRFNPEYFQRLRRRVEEAGERGIYVSVMLFDGFSVGTKGPANFNNPWRGHPFNGANNVNGVDGDLNHDGLGYEVQTLASDTVVRVEDAYVKHVVDVLDDLDNVLYEICNESDSGSVAWQYHMIDLIHRYEGGKPKRHPVGMTAIWPGGDNVDLFASSADWISPFGRWPLSAPAASDGRKVVLLDTDHLCGLCGTVAWVWESLARGYNTILMDGYDSSGLGTGGMDYRRLHVPWEDVRRNMGYARSFAERMDLAAARPDDDACSTGYCLVAPGEQYLVFVPGGGATKVDVTGARGTLDAEWFDPANGETVIAAPVAGGAVRTFAPPFPGDAVLFLHAPSGPPRAASGRRGRAAAEEDQHGGALGP